MNTRQSVLRHENGLIAVDQGTFNRWIITYNPDDNRYYVHRPDENLTVEKTYKDLRNAKQFARAHSI